MYYGADNNINKYRRTSTRKWKTKIVSVVRISIRFYMKLIWIASQRKWLEYNRQSVKMKWKKKNVDLSSAEKQNIEHSSLYMYFTLNFQSMHPYSRKSQLIYRNNQHERDPAKRRLLGKHARVFNKMNTMTTNTCQTMDESRTDVLNVVVNSIFTFEIRINPMKRIWK